MEGLWTIEFGSNTGTFGSGVISIRSGRIEGGDSTYYYLGTIEEAIENQVLPRPFRARILAKPFLQGAPSVFGTVGREIELILEGTLKDENNAVAVGRPEGMPELNLGVRLTRRN